MKSLVLAGLLLCYTGTCSETTAPEPNPGWVTRLIEQYAGEPVTNPPRSIWKARYHGQPVYYVPPICCDQFSALYDWAGNLLCAPDGGFTGKGDGRCDDYARAHTDSELIWRDPRTRP